jgi:ADP-ribose pyrophosphatase YjhB (NUDIX family)
MKHANQPRRITHADTGEAIKQNFLERARNGLFSVPYPGYPLARYVSDSPGVTTVPDGEWSLQNDHAQPLSTEQLEALKARGVDFSSDGNPIHPWLNDMISDPDIGVVGGPGAYWNFGPNYTADPIVISRIGKKVLLIRRDDTGSWALPGGFLDGNNEDPVHAARRELAEETRLGRIIRVVSKPVLLYAGIVADKRTTAVSWADTHAVLLRPLIPWFHVKGDDGATDARWFKLNELPRDFFGSHSILVDLAKDYINGDVIID